MQRSNERGREGVMGETARAELRPRLIKHPERKQCLCEGTLPCKKKKEKKGETESIWNNVPVILGESTRLENYLNKSKEVYSL